jgi:hypothetical protein
MGTLQFECFQSFDPWFFSPSQSKNIIIQTNVAKRSYIWVISLLDLYRRIGLADRPGHLLFFAIPSAALKILAALKDTSDFG